MAFTEAQEAKIAAIMSERSITHKAALKIFHAENKTAVVTIESDIEAAVANVKAIQAQLKDAKAALAAARKAIKTNSAADKAAKLEAKAKAKAEKAAVKAQAKADAQAQKAAAKETKAKARAEAKAKKAAEKAAQPKKQRESKLPVEQITSLYQAGKTIGAIAKETGSSYMGIRLLLIRTGIFGTVVAPPKAAS